MIQRFLIACVVLFSSAIHAQVLEGKIISSKDSTPLGHAAVYVDGEKYHANYTKPDGSFYVYGLSNDTHRIRIQYQTFRDTSFTFVFDSAHYVFEFQYTIICDYDQSGTKHDCPVCHKQDQVIPISYGYPSSIGIERANKGEIYLGGCMVSDCDPQWHCKRCKKEF